MNLWQDENYETHLNIFCKFIFSTGAKWKTCRCLSAPVFLSTHALKNCITIFNERIAICINRLQTLTETEESSNLFGYCLVCILDIICDWLKKVFSRCLSVKILMFKRANFIMSKQC